MTPVDPDIEQQQIPVTPVLRDDPKFAAGKIAAFQYVGNQHVLPALAQQAR